MTDQHKDDAMLKEYLDGNSGLSKEYEKQEQHQPSAELDELILSAARHEAKKSKRNRNTWLIPTSIAATLVLSFSLIQLQKPAMLQLDEKEMDVAVVAEQPKLQPLEKKKERRMKQDMKAVAPIEEQMADQQAPASAPAPAMAIGLMADSETRPARKEIGVSRLASNVDAESLLPESKWLEKIRHLLKENKVAEAKQEYERFIKAYPKFVPGTELKQQLGLEE